MLTERTRELGGVALNVAEGGACGTPLLLLPGATLSWLSDTLRSGRTFDDIVARCRLRDPGLDDAAAQEMARSVGRVDPGVVAAAPGNRLREEYPFEQVTSAISCPLLLVRSDPARGSSVRDSDAASIATHVRGSRVVQVPGACSSGAGQAGRPCGMS